jgi:DUF1680 family protein
VAVSHRVPAVRLRPSAYLTAVESNRAYLLRLEPDRLLHNYRINAGLEPRGAIYGGWESESIAGHTLGHYLSALSLLYAQTGESLARRHSLAWIRFEWRLVTAIQLAQGVGGSAGC